MPRRSERPFVELEELVAALIDEELLGHLSPLGWEHVNLTGGYVWTLGRPMKPGAFRQLRTAGEP